MIQLTFPVPEPPVIRGPRVRIPLKALEEMVIAHPQRPVYIVRHLVDLKTGKVKESYIEREPRRKRDPKEILL